MPIGKIIVGFKGGECSRDALRFGAMLARDIDAELVVAHAYLPAHGFRASASERTVLRANASALLAEAESLLPYATRAELRAVEGRPVQALQALAEDEAADLIVVGSSTRGALEMHAVGGVAERLLHAAPCPVAVAPRDYRYERNPGLYTIGVAVDGSSESKAAVLAAADLARAMNAGFRLIGIAEAAPPVVGLGASYLPADGSYRDALQRELEEIADSLPAKLRPEVVLVDGEPAAELINRAAPLSLLVMGSRAYGPLRRALLGSVSSHVLRDAPCPVYVVPRGSVEVAPAATG